MQTELRQLVWVGSSKKDLSDFPRDVMAELGRHLMAVQYGLTPKAAKPLTGLGSGVFEIVVNFDTNAYRVAFTVRFAQTVYVLHSFQKKSVRRIKTPKPDIEIIRHRLQEAKRIDELLKLEQ